MRVFFNTFVKVLATFLALAVFILILSSAIPLINKQEKLNNFEYIKGNKNSKNLIAILNLNGPLVSNPITFNSIASLQTIDPSYLEIQLNSLTLLKPKILIVTLNSPGGTVTASYEVYEMLRKFKKQNNIKLYFHTNETLASGAYWVAQSGDKIYASYGSIIGSIGVKGPDWIYFDKPIAISTGVFGNNIETKNGISVYSQNAGESKDLLNPFRKPTNKELIKLKEIVNNIYDDFVTIVSKKRKIEINTLKKEIGALIYEPQKAKENFLIDEVISLNSLIDKIIVNQKFKEYVIYESTNNQFSIFENYFLKLFDKPNLEKNIIFKNSICDKFRTNISSINRNYLFNC